MAADPDIQASLAEAAAYERLQWRRRRGVYAGLLSLGWLALGLYRTFHLDLYQWLFVGVLLVAAAVVFFARRRPAWKGVFVHPDHRGPLLKTWPGRILGFLLLLGYAILSDFSGSVLVTGRIVLFSLGLAFILRTRGDRTMQWVLVSTAGMAALVLLGLVPAATGFGAWLIVLGTSWLVVAVARVFGPASWVIP